MTRRRTIALGAGLAATGAMLRRRSTRVPTDPFDPDAIRAETAAARTAEIVGRPRVRRVDLAQTYAPAIATAVDPLLHGRRYFPRMLEDIAAATDHVHLLIYGYKAGDIGETFLTALADRVAAGVEVRLSVDAIGSEVDFGSKDLFRRLLAAGVEVVAQDGIAVIRTGDLADRSFRPRGEDLLHFDHRKMAVIDGRVGYVGGSGIEDHYNDERFYDVMCRVEGPIVAQLQSVFLLSWRHHDGPAPAIRPWTGTSRSRRCGSRRTRPSRRRRRSCGTSRAPAITRSATRSRPPWRTPPSRSTSSTRTSPTGPSSSGSLRPRCAGSGCG